MIIDPDTLSANRLYHTMLQTIIPRPVAWVLSDNGTGTGTGTEKDTQDNYNLAPFSYFAPVSSEPPVLMISIGKKPDGSDKDTFVNIAARQHFVVHIANSELATQVTASAATLPHGESEVTRLNLALTDFPPFSLPRLACSQIAYACELLEIKPLGNVPQQLVFGVVKQIYIADDLMEENNGRYSISAAKVDPLGRIGGDEYWIKGRVITVPRPK